MKLDNIFNEMYEDFQKDKLKFMSGKTTETEAEIAARMNKENKEAVERIKNKKLIDDAIEMYHQVFQTIEELMQKL